MKSWLIGKDSDAGRDWGQEEKGSTEDEMAGWHHRLDGHEFVWTLGVGDGQGGLACCDSWGHKESDTTARLNWTELNWILFLLFPTLDFFVLWIWKLLCSTICGKLPAIIVPFAFGLRFNCLGHLDWDVIHYLLKFCSTLIFYYFQGLKLTNSDPCTKVCCLL